MRSAGSIDMYQYGLLKPERVPGAELTNAALLGPQTLGIEVTEPSLAARCGLGNIDPQHSGDRRAEIAAIDLCLTAQLPLPGARLVTLRADLDSLGSMALLTLRAKRLEVTELTRLRVRQASTLDRFAHGPWPGPRPLPWDEDAASRDTGEKGDALLAAALASDDTVSLEDRVTILCRWLCADAEGELDTIRPTLAPYAEQIEAERAALAAGFREDRLNIKVTAGRQIARIESYGLPGGVRLGYCLAPVVVACDHAFRFRDSPPHRKFTVCQYAEGYLDLRGALRDLVAMEPGWGGSPTIIGSPQGVASRLSIDQVTDVAERNLVRDTEHGG
jgi:hypothetical protein